MLSRLCPLLIWQETLRLKDELTRLQKQRELIATKARELQQTRLRVRPKDVATLQRARQLVNPDGADLRAASQEEDREVDGAQKAVDRLQRKQRELLQSSQARRADLERELVEERILRDELAGEVDA